LRSADGSNRLRNWDAAPEGFGEAVGQDAPRLVVASSELAGVGVAGAARSSGDAQGVCDTARKSVLVGPSTCSADGTVESDYTHRVGGGAPAAVAADASQPVVEEGMAYFMAEGATGEAGRSGRGGEGDPVDDPNSSGEGGCSGTKQGYPGASMCNSSDQSVASVLGSSTQYNALASGGSMSSSFTKGSLSTSSQSLRERLYTPPVIPPGMSMSGMSMSGMSMSYASPPHAVLPTRKSKTGSVSQAGAGETQRAEAPTVEDVDDHREELDLMYDPMLNCYYDPKTNKYYELK